jgi:hypothetical protein
MLYIGGEIFKKMKEHVWKYHNETYWFIQLIYTSKKMFSKDGGVKTHSSV